MKFFFFRKMTIKGNRGKRDKKEKFWEDLSASKESLCWGRFVWIKGIIMLGKICLDLRNFTVGEDLSGSKEFYCWGRFVWI